MADTSRINDYDLLDMIEYCTICSSGEVLCQAHYGRNDIGEEEWGIINSIINKVPGYDNRHTYRQKDSLYHYVMEKGVLYLCTSRIDFPQRTAFAFLGEVIRKFEKTVCHFDPETLKPLSIPKSACSSFSPVIFEALKHFNSPGSDKVTTVRRQIDDIKHVMLQNIDSVIRRGEHIDTLVDRTSELSSYADCFKVRSRTLQRKVVWQNIKTLGILVICFIVLCTIFGMMVCDINFKRCR